ncbi:MAG: hypothetical protein ABJ059_13975, partial [Hyphomicrobiales bacterium]
RWIIRAANMSPLACLSLLAVDSKPVLSSLKTKYELCQHTALLPPWGATVPHDNNVRKAEHYNVFPVSS